MGNNSSKFIELENETITSKTTKSPRQREPWLVILSLCSVNSLFFEQQFPRVLILRIFSLYHTLTISCAIKQQNSMIIANKLLQLKRPFHMINPSHWMTEIYQNQPEVKLSQIIIPGTHDSATNKGFSAISKTQNKTVYDQFLDGIRYLDLRVGNDLIITHGIEKGPTLSLVHTFDQIQMFSMNHPKEILFIDLHVIPTEEREMKKLSTCIIEKLGSYLIKSDNLNPEIITFDLLWNQYTNRNIFLLVRQYNDLIKTIDPSLIWDKRLGQNDNYFTNSKNDNWGEVWPDSINFQEIEIKNRLALKNRHHTKWHMSQLIRTPRVRHAVMTVTGLSNGPYQLVTEKTNYKGIGGHNFAKLISKWVYEWSMELDLSVNFVATDFYEETSLVPMSLWINLIKSFMANMVTN